MNRKREEIKEKAVNKYISRSMMAYPSDKSIMPLIFHLNMQHIIEEITIQQYNDQIMKCRLCGSFFNPYCQINDNSINWKCSVCNSINQLPLPPSDSIFTAYSVAKNTVCYNNAVFDFVPPHLPIKNHQNPKIIISVQSSIYNDVKDILLHSLKENDIFSYGLTIFDSSLHLFNFHLKSWHIISDFEDNDNFIFPTKQEFLFSNASNLKNILSTSYEFTSNEKQNIKIVCKFIECFQNVKLLLILNGPTTSSLPPISFPVSVVFFENSNDEKSYESFYQWSNNPTSNFFHFKPIQINNNCDFSVSPKSTYTQLIIFLSRSLFTPFKNNIQIKLRAPKIFEINQEKEDYHIFTVSRRQSSVAQILSFAQFEIFFNDCLNDGISTFRYINVKIPLSPDPRIFRSATFPIPLHHLSVAASFLIARLREFAFLEHETIFLKLRNKLMEISFQFPLTDSFWAHFVHQILNSDILNDPQNFSEGNLNFLILKNLPHQIALLHFLPFQYVNGKLLPLYPKENDEAIARVTENEIQVLSGNDISQIACNICTLLGIDEFLLPVFEVQSFEKIKDDEVSFNQWQHDFDLLKYKYMEDKRNRKK